MSNADTSPHRSLTGWAVPLTAAVIGLGYLVAGIVGGDLGFGIFGLALMIVVAGVFLLASRHSETVAGLRDRRDERINQLDATASQVAGAAVLAAVLVMFVVEVARGHSGSPYYQLGALGGVSYVVALVYLRFRR